MQQYPFSFRNILKLKLLKIKGSSVIRMMNAFLTINTFKSAIKVNTNHSHI